VSDELGVSRHAIEKSRERLRHESGRFLRTEMSRHRPRGDPARCESTRLSGKFAKLVAERCLSYNRLLSLQYIRQTSAGRFLRVNQAAGYAKDDLS
jgi:hypothetical protein